MHKVGQQCRHWIDASRPNWLGRGKRPLNVTIWYPAGDDATEEALVFGASEPFFRLTGVAVDAPLSGSPDQLPLVLLSHGTGGQGLHMGWLGRHLAARGYLAATVDHHGNNSTESYAAQGFLLWWERVKDLSAVLDHLFEDRTFGARIDGRRIGVAGFSLGGYTAVGLVGGRCSLEHFRRFGIRGDGDVEQSSPPEFPDAVASFSRLMASDPAFRASVARHQDSYQDRRVQAAFLMNPALGSAFEAEALAVVDKPVHVVVAAGDDIVPPEANGHRYARLLPNAELTSLEGSVGHYVFLSEPTAAGIRHVPELCEDQPGVDRAAVQHQVAELACTFFARHLA